MQIKYAFFGKNIYGDTMKNRINLNNFNIHTDLVIDNMNSINKNNVIENKKYSDDINITKVTLDEYTSKLLGKKKGKYITIEFEDITNYEDREIVGKVFENELKSLLNNIGINNEDECLVIGLGNNKSTPDSLGPKVISNIVVTRHLFEICPIDVKEGMRCVSTFVPGVMADTGIESADIIFGIVKDIKPKFMVVIDAVASNSIDRINKTIQITDTGIHPGSGIGNNRKEISKETMGIPVIAIGVPTVVDTSTVVGDTINYLFKHISYIKDNYNKNKLIFNRKNYINKIKDRDLTKEEKKEVGGIIGELEDNELKDLFREVLNSINYNMMVTVKEIDFVIEKLSSVISNGINNSLHNSINNF